MSKQSKVEVMTKQPNIAIDNLVASYKSEAKSMGVLLTMLGKKVWGLSRSEGKR